MGEDCWREERRGEERQRFERISWQACGCCKKIRTPSVLTGKCSVSLFLSQAQTDSHLLCLHVIPTSCPFSLLTFLLPPFFSLHLTTSPLPDTSPGKSLSTSTSFSSWSPVLTDLPALFLSFCSQALLLLPCGHHYKKLCLPPIAQWCCTISAFWYTRYIECKCLLSLFTP